jgi:N-acetylglucosamine kinase-like BadF-type ATPase
MTIYFLGVDVGATRTRALVADEHGLTAGVGQAGPGNHETVGYDGMRRALESALDQALDRAGIGRGQIAGSGFGVAGYDWPSEREPTLACIELLGLDTPLEAVNDTILGLLAGSDDGWGVAVVSGTGCNCRGWDRARREGRVTGNGLWMGEAAGASELMFKVVQALAHEWTRRGPSSALTPALLRHTGARSLDDLLEGLVMNRIALDASAAPLVFQVAAAGDPVAVDLVHWAGRELGEMANAVIRQIDLLDLEFDVILTGSMFEGGPLLVEPMRDTIHALAPRARLVRLAAPPVTGAVLLGMDQAGMAHGPAVRRALARSASEAITRG